VDWEGEWLEGERHGVGQLSLRDGSVVSGVWEGNAWAGGGARIVYGNGSGVYEGGVVAETWQRQGRGVWRGSNGEVYEGDWSSDQRSGHGHLTQPPRTYIGEFCNNLPDGDGSLSYGSGLRYTGRFSQGLRHGRGVLEFPRGLSVAALWAADKAEQLLAVDRSRCLALAAPDVTAAAWEFKSCRGSALAALVADSGSSLRGQDDEFDSCVSFYEGGLAEGVLQGCGLLLMPCGSLFFGHFSAGQRRGNGRFLAANGDSYDGEWLDDEWQGSGVLTLASGHEIRGQWLQSCPNERVCMKFPSGGEYNGAYVRGVKRGQGLHVFASGCKYEGLWSDGVFHGSGQLSQPVLLLSHVLDGPPPAPAPAPAGAASSPPPSSDLPCITLAFDLQELPLCFPLARLYLDGITPTTPLAPESPHKSASSTTTTTTTTFALFSGFFIDGRREGKGRQIFSDGCAYDGEWKADMFHGRGILSLASGSVYKPLPLTSTPLLCFKAHVLPQIQRRVAGGQAVWARQFCVRE